MSNVTINKGNFLYVAFMTFKIDYQKEQGDANFFNGSDADRTKTDMLFKVNAASLLGARSPQQTEFTYQFIEANDKNKNHSDFIRSNKFDYGYDPNGGHRACSMDHKAG